MPELAAMSLMMTNIMVWLAVVLAVAGLLIYLQQRVQRENGGWAPWRWLLPRLRYLRGWEGGRIEKAGIRR